MDPLREWVVREGKLQVSNDIAAESIPSMGGGVGVVAAKALPAGRTIVEVPQPFMLTTRLARHYLGALRPSPTASDVQALTPVEAIMSFLVLAEHDAQHPFYPWLSALPRRYDNLLELPYPLRPEGCQEAEHDATAAMLYDAAIKPFVWSRRCREKCVEERLRFETSVARCKARIPQLRRVGEADASSIPATATSGAAAIAAVGPIPLATFLWAYNSLMSRGFAYDDDIWAMMPWVDYFNYSLFPNVTMRYHDKRRRYEFITKQPIAAGTQLLLQYGTYSDFELALWYGFTLTRVLFPRGVAPKRCTTTDDEGTDACGASNLDEALVQRNTHDAYVFSPTYDPNGDLPLGLGWATALAAQADLVCPEAWHTTQGHDAALHDVRIAWGCVNAGMKYLLRRLVEANRTLSSGAILRRVVASELQAFETDAVLDARGVPPRDDGLQCFSATRIARDMSEDQVVLLKRYLAMDEKELQDVINA